MEQSQLGKELDYFYSYFNKLYEDYKDQYERYVGEKQLEILNENVRGIITENSRYIPIELKQNINTLTFCKKILKDRFQNINLTLEVFENAMLKQNTKIKLSKYIIRVVYIIIFLCSKICPLHEVHTLNMKIICSPFKKRLSRKQHNICDKGIATYNINSGVTTTFMNTGVAEIIVYRQEEVIKVIIHELLHAFGLDSKLMTPETEAPLNAFFGLTTSQQHTLRTNESFTDTYACLLNVFLATKFLCSGVVDSMTDKYVFRGLVSKELIYIVGRANKLFPFLGIELDAKTKKLVNKCDTRTEQTHVISYYILKAMNFVNLVVFLKYLRNNNYKSQDDGVLYVEHLLKLLKII
jgi:hypothetical protein